MSYVKQKNENVKKYENFKKNDNFNRNNKNFTRNENYNDRKSNLIILVIDTVKEIIIISIIIIDQCVIFVRQGN